MTTDYVTDIVDILACKGWTLFYSGKDNPYSHQEKLDDVLGAPFIPGVHLLNKGHYYMVLPHTNDEQSYPLSQAQFELIVSRNFDLMNANGNIPRIRLGIQGLPVLYLRFFEEYVSIGVQNPVEMTYLEFEAGLESLNRFRNYNCN
jgi:hypothetical protein